MIVRIAIIGRPNVGKSTLFNRLAGKKLAIVDDQPGVTRDRREADGRLGDLDLLLIDTAGYEDVNDDSLEARMRAQTEAGILDADICLFLIDARAGITPGDNAFGELLRKADRPVILAANKAEGLAAEAGINEAWTLGFGEPVPISGEHGEGMADLYVAIRRQLAKLGRDDDPNAVEDEWPDETPAEEVVIEYDEEGNPIELPEAPEVPDAEKPPLRIAIIGRPNAGKSTLINALIGEHRLLTGPEAGITRDSIAIDWEWNERHVRLVDTAGLRRKARIAEKLEILSVADTLRAIKFAEICLLVMSADEAFEKQDLQIADLVAREGRGLVYVISKFDLVENRAETLADLKEKADRLLPQTRGAPLVPISSLNGTGLEHIMDAVVSVHHDWNARIKTRDLNDWLHEALQKQPPPAVDGRRIKPRYIAQIKARPPTFVLLASRAAQLPDSYVRYLTNGIRKAFALPAVPIRFHVRAPKNPYVTTETGQERPRVQKITRSAERAVKKKGAAAKSAATKAMPKKTGKPVRGAGLPGKRVGKPTRKS